MTQYTSYDIHLTEHQKKQIASAVQRKTGVKIRFTYNQLNMNPNTKIQLTPTQFKKLQRSATTGKGAMLTISWKQLEYHQKGGFLPLLLPALVGAVAPFLLNKLFPDKSSSGEGLVLPGQQPVQRKRLPPIPAQKQENTYHMGNGINLPMGRGVNSPDIRPLNGENTSYHITGSESSYLPDSYANIFRINRKQVNLPSRPVKGRGLAMQPYINPQSERFQMLQ